MRKAAIRDGDPTTTGGFVIASSTSIRDKGGKKVAMDGDEATCGNCNGTHKIFGTGKGLFKKGRNVVVEDDQVLCPCGKNRVMVGDNPGIFLKTAFDSSTSVGTKTGGASGASSAVHDELEHYFEIVDATTGAPIEGMTYKLLSDGVSLVDNESLAGKTMVLSKNDYPNLSFIAWRTGDVR
jgi:hypothetical protein